MAERVWESCPICEHDHMVSGKPMEPAIAAFRAEAVTQASPLLLKVIDAARLASARYPNGSVAKAIRALDGHLRDG